MNNSEVHDIILKHICKEIDQIAERMQKNSSMSSSDLEELDKIFHLKKSMLTCKAMEDAEDYKKAEDGWSSEYRNSGRSERSENGKFMSRDMEESNRQSFANGFSEGYSEAMNQMNRGGSGHYPMMPQKYPRW